MNKLTRNLTLTSVFVALNVVLGVFITIPLGVIRAAPMQHLINVLGAVFTGPWVIVQAFVSSTIRVLLGTGTIFAYPGSMIGALLAYLLYRYTKKLAPTALGEVLGTGIIGALSLYPLMLILDLDTNVYAVIALAFLVSSAIGATVSYFILKALEKRGVLNRL
ncbi:energy coupling factor transporter S component ThiW [Jeotgalicoccus huakuii]|uniref:energy coupling factor transporter S component ThiW n=1 Tax=Jeotgalicoccus TaxID=227979 RepID=UPI0003FF4F60|nr:MULTISPECIES: energy coupling factor transporter S component ThiW [Jeotgalicoccus]MCK1975480.1 energy coupling factor transporter S component ThiW [Jeotgalicoccus huakuii]QQD85692.1 energy coupling factor transporter S component ThiW [Jeotgalicoccus sp. ATCC 8456]